MMHMDRANRRQLKLFSEPYQQMQQDGRIKTTRQRNPPRR